MKRIIIIYWVFAGLVACDGDGAVSNIGPDSSVISSGLKIFVTAETHVGNFLDDPTLAGNSGIEKADSFCAASSSRPDGATYKALLVDGVNRDAVSLTNWVLEADTTYYRVNNNIEIGTTTGTAIFSVLFTPLINSIADPEQLPPELGYVWTGIGDTGNFSAGDHCDFWSSHSASFSGVLGIYHEKDRAAFHPVNLSGGTCNSNPQLYCVEQIN